MGNVIWQHEAAEFVEQYPPRRHPKTAALLLRQSASAGTLYRKPETVIPTLNKRASGGELLTPQQRHQRDLFSGDLGIPDVNSHVGSVVHTFETMALQRQLAERQRAQREHEHSKYLVELLTMQAAAEAAAVVAASTSALNATTPTTATATAKRSFISCGTTGNSSKFHQLKKKTHEARQKIVQQILQQNTQPSSNAIISSQSQGTPRHIIGHFQASCNSEVYYRNIDEDYRKNLFGTLTQRKILPFEETTSKCPDLETASYCEESQIVNQAFDEIFEGYSGLEEDEDSNELETNALSPPDHLQPSNFMKQYARPGLTPKKLPTISHRKGPPPPPPKSAATSSGQLKHKIMPFSENKQRSSTLHNLLEKLKAPPQKYPTALRPFNKTSSDSLLKTDNLQIPSSKHLHKFPPHLHLNREVEGQESFDGRDQDFLRGSTLSQSFVRHMKVHKPTKAKAPPVPLATQSAKRQLKTSEALRQVLLFSKRSKSSGELLPQDEYTSVEPRKYYRRLDENEYKNEEQQKQRPVLKHPHIRERYVDGACGLTKTAGSNLIIEI